ncbi:hypothetical protein A2U01_0051683 [Trifolium medium]|uniref:Uncharacterized protein n=1 Tax=Trifolium medium TaxID=97028 RepID=A0A392R300_9FABA|nr:hypothetical protein [Trifolium medium]
MNGTILQQSFITSRIFSLGTGGFRWEGNACADYLAKLCAQNVEAYSRISTPPDGINQLLLADASGTWLVTDVVYDVATPG